MPLPEAGCLLDAVERFLELTHAVVAFAVGVRLLDEDECVDGSVEEGIFYDDLEEQKMLCCCDGKEDADGGVAADESKGLVEIDDVTLVETTHDPAGLETLNGSVSSGFDVEDPLAQEDSSPLQRSMVSENLGFESFKHGDLGIHGRTPFLAVGAGKSLARGFGFDRFWWVGDSGVEAEDVESGKAGAVLLLAGDLHHIVVGVVSGEWDGAEQRVTR
ncbi:unnamed protein product [Closterium sp. NIES-53]